ncbi:hypothetical protein BCR34DRAFT_260416 [Clohesyomyces aquaticus]|uniref:TPR domain protein n=1 Tax=Clohesyomyces aquaticus TaxID=1231657 RepID=A0A1Y2A9P3_9PLEO|nr:hypothetical protein BCR34DRAFT_260416 [Clohesyomyces aquaticus]
MTSHTDDDYEYSLGSFRRTITTSSASTQTWFDRGIIWTYAFHHEEAVKCFENAISSDVNCPMAYWGVSFALGPNYNKPWDLFDDKELRITLEKIRGANQKAKSVATSSSPVEQALVDAIQCRVPQDLSQIAFRACNEAYAAAMAVVYQKFPEDLDVVTLYADSLMNLAAWDLWDLRTGEPNPGARSLETKAILERALPHAYNHPGLLHLYIHLMEMSRTPEAAVVAADHLRALAPDAGHLVHMPSHLDILIGDYRRAIASNMDACKADEKYLHRSGGENFYTFYRLHDYHSLVYAAMFAGQSKVALSTCDRIEASLPESLLRVESPPMADWLESWASVRVHVLVRFGRWDEILQLEFPQDQDLFCVTTAVLHYGRGIAHSVLGNVDEASKERELLRAAVLRVPSTRIAHDFPNKCTVVLKVAEAMLDGELEYSKGNYELAFENLRKSIELDDNLVYAEPWPWMQPTRHAYGALLLDQGHVEQALRVYAADLGFDDTLPRARQHPNNIFALVGYEECLRRLGRIDESKIIKQQLVLAQAVADITINASCYCRRTTSS